ncbi:uncharacterized protein LOC131440409 [Malaya genurostris]|uniref:uncharacterized protein LOC131440409 n=1 Tax=Malaya genurostris TaxID=325434 RepID=UPI0026F39ACB|nr:uncharacterized protein LOC131440409 [Malaya genurostris]
MDPPDTFNDQGSSAKAIELRCHMKGCGLLLKGGVDRLDELKYHYRNVHQLNTSSKNVLPFMCSICNGTYLKFYHLKAHILKCHLEYNQETVEDSHSSASLRSNEMDTEYAADNNVSDFHLITNPFFFEPPVTLEQVSLEMLNQITKMHCDVSLPESKIKVFIEGWTTLLKWCQQYTVTIVKKFVEAKGLLYEDSMVIQMFNDLLVPNVYNDVKTIDDNLSYLAMQAKCMVPTPREIIIAKRRKIKHVFTGSKFQSRKQNYKQKVKIEKDVAHYIPLIDTLRLIISNPEARNMICTEDSGNNDMICSYKDSAQYQKHQFLQRFPYALRLSIHIDDVEYLNPLGSRKGKKKLTNISFKIQNLLPAINSGLSRTYLTFMVRSTLLKKYGFKQILEPLIIGNCSW